MTFLNALFLTALPLAIFPVILHFYRRKRRDEVPWGAMQFLEDALHHGRRGMRMESWLLLAARILLVGLLIVALSRPMVSRTASQSQAKHVILIVDNTMSTSRVQTDSSPWERIVTEARTIVEKLGPQDHLGIMSPVGDRPLLFPTATAVTADARRTWLRHLQQLHPTQGTADLRALLQTAVQSDDRDDQRQRHVVVLTDGQKNNWHIGDSIGWHKLRDTLDQPSHTTTVELIDCGESRLPRDNVSLRLVPMANTHVQPNMPVRLKAELHNHSDHASEAKKCQWLVDGESQGETVIPVLSPGESATTEWNWTPLTPGNMAVQAKLDGQDQLQLDDSDHTIFAVVQETPILVCSQADPKSLELKAFMAALGYDASEPTGDWHSVYRPHLVTPSAFDGSQLAKFPAVVFLDLPLLETEFIDALERYVQRGGGVWILANGRIDIAQFNQWLYRNGIGLCPLALEGITTLAQLDDVGSRIHAPTHDHPATRHLGDTQRLDIHDIRVRRRYQFSPGDLQRPVSRLLESATGDPLLIESFLGRGRAVTQAFPLDRDWSTLTLSKAYVVLVHNVLDYLASPALPQYNLTPGQPIEWVTGDPTHRERLAISLPDGQTSELSGIQANGSTTYRYAHTQTPGLYRIQQSAATDSMVARFHVSRTSEESDLTRWDANDTGRLASQFAIHVEQSPQALWTAKPTPTATPQPHPAWSPLLLAVLLLLGIELWLANRSLATHPPITI